MPECIFIVYFHSHYICHNLTYQRQNHWIVSAWLYIVQESSCFVFFNICNGDKYLVHPGTLSLLLVRWYAILYHRSFSPKTRSLRMTCFTAVLHRDCTTEHESGSTMTCIVLGSPHCSNNHLHIDVYRRKYHVCEENFLQ